MDIGAAGAEIVGGEFRMALGPADLVFASMAALDSQSLARDGEVEVGDAGGAAVVWQGKDVGAMELNLVRGEGRWYLEAELGLSEDGPSGAEASYASRGELCLNC